MVRPRKPIDYGLVEELAAQGLTNAQMAPMAGFELAQWYVKKRTDPELTDAIKRGTARGIQGVTNSLFQNAVERRDTIACIFWLKNRAQWSDKTEVSADQKAPLQVQVVSYGSSQADIKQVDSADIQVTHYGTDGQRQLTDKYGKAIPQQKGGADFDNDSDNG